MNDEQITQALEEMYWGSSETIEVPVAYILRNAKSSVDWGDCYDDVTWWESGIADKAADSGFGHLVESILTNGWDYQSTVGFDGETIQEGHHRLVAAILLGMDTVPVTPWGSSGRSRLCAHYDDVPFSIYVED